MWDRLLPGSATRRGAEALELERCSARGHGMAQQGREETTRKARQGRKRGRGPGGVRVSDVVQETGRRGRRVGVSREAACMCGGAECRFSRAQKFRDQGHGGEARTTRQAAGPCLCARAKRSVVCVQGPERCAAGRTSTSSNSSPSMADRLEIVQIRDYDDGNDGGKR